MEQAEEMMKDDSDLIVLEIHNIKPNRIEQDHECIQSTSSGSEIPLRAWEMCSISHILVSQRQVIKVLVHRSRLVENSQYFRSLFEGGFKEALSDYAILEWHIATFLTLMQYFYGQKITVTAFNFTLLLESALFFGVEKLLTECKSWITSALAPRKTMVCDTFLEQLIDIWVFAIENGMRYIEELVTDFLAINFDEITCHNCLCKMPHGLLRACTSHPQLTVESEKQLCTALLNWLEKNQDYTEGEKDTKDGPPNILKMIRVGFLPLEFILGLLWKAQPLIVDTVRKTHIFDHIVGICHFNPCNVEGQIFQNFLLRLTHHTEKLDLSDCQQITGMMLYRSLEPLILANRTSMTVSDDKFRHIAQRVRLHIQELRNYNKQTNFLSNLKEINISKCWRLADDDIIPWLRLSSLLRVFTAAYCYQLNFSILYNILQEFPQIEVVDLSVDVSHLAFKNVLIEQNNVESYLNCTSSNLNLWRKSVCANLRKLSLQGRTDLTDDDLTIIAELSNSLNVINLNGCLSLTDYGITRLLKICKNLHSLHVACTLFGPLSISELNIQLSSSSSFLEIDLGNCRGVDRASIIEFLRLASSLSSLSLWNTQVDDDGLYAFQGIALKKLDVSQTLVSRGSLTYIISRNLGLKVLKARDCKQICTNATVKKPDIAVPSCKTDEFLQVLCQITDMEELSIGWGLEDFVMGKLMPMLKCLKVLSVGLGGSLTSNILMLLPRICPLLESACFCFQLISDEGILNILKHLKYLHTLELRYCLGDLTPNCLKVCKANLKVLKLERVCPWLTDDDILLLINNFSGLSQITLIGCKLLTPGAQEIIASGWPALTAIHLEECPDVTRNGVLGFLECKAIEDLSLLHTGRGINKNFIKEAVLNLPLLRTLALDLCDALESGFDTPNYKDRNSLCNVSLVRCKLQKPVLDFQSYNAKSPLVKLSQTIVIEWNNKEVRTTIVSGRL